MGTLEEVTGAVLPYALLAAVLAGVYVYRDKIWELISKNPATDAANEIQKSAYNLGYDAGLSFLALSDKVKCSLGDQAACDRVAWADAGYPSVTPTKWNGDPENITIGSMSLLPSGLLSAIYGPPNGAETSSSETGGNTDQNYLAALAGVEPAKPITGPLKPGTLAGDLPDKVPYESQFGDIVKSWSKYTTNFNIIDQKGDLLLYRAQNNWGIIDLSQKDLAGNRGKEIASGSIYVPIPYGRW